MSEADGYRDTEFAECPECCKKPGMAQLCPACLHNRATIETLVQENKRLIDLGLTAWISSLPKDDCCGRHLILETVGNYTTPNLKALALEGYNEEKFQLGKQIQINCPRNNHLLTKRIGEIDMKIAHLLVEDKE